MKFFIKTLGASEFQGPLTFDEIKSELENGSFTPEHEILEATGQSYSALKGAAGWRKISDICPSSELPAPKTKSLEMGICELCKQNAEIHTLHFQYGKFKTWRTGGLTTYQLHNESILLGSIEVKFCTGCLEARNARTMIINWPIFALLGIAFPILSIRQLRLNKDGLGILIPIFCVCAVVLMGKIGGYRSPLEFARRFAKTRVIEKLGSCVGLVVWTPGEAKVIFERKIG